MIYIIHIATNMQVITGIMYRLSKLSPIIPDYIVWTDITVVMKGPKHVFIYLILASVLDAFWCVDTNVVDVSLLCQIEINRIYEFMFRVMSMFIGALHDGLCCSLDLNRRQVLRVIQSNPTEAEIGIKEISSIWPLHW